jgi:hypothetical protein
METQFVSESYLAYLFIIFIEVLHKVHKSAEEKVKLEFRTSSGRRPSFTATIDFRRCNRLLDVGRTLTVSGNLKNACLEFGIFHLSFTVLELLLLPVYGGYYPFPVFQHIARRRSFYGCVGDLENVRSAFGIFQLSFTVLELRLLLVYGSAISFWCSNTSCDVGHTSSLSGDLINVRLAFGVFSCHLLCRTYFYFRSMAAI